MCWWDSLYESSVIADWNEQLGPYEVQDQELVVLQWQLEAAWIVVDMVWSGDGLDTATKRQARSAAAIQWYRHSDLSDAVGPVWHAASPDNRVRPELAAAGWVGLGYTGFQHLMSTSADTEREPAVLRIYRATEPPNRQHRHQGRRWRRVERTQARRLQAPCLA